MRFISTNSVSHPVSIVEALDRCVAEDGGMFMPESIPALPKAFFNNIGEMSLKEIAFVVADTLLDGDVAASTLKTVAYESFSADAPLVKVGDNTYILELFHGPTLTFKDYGARAMACFMKRVSHSRPGMKRNVLVATTGNTGAAAANGLLGLDGVNVSVLYPKGFLTRSQTAQFTALGKNIHAVEIAGTVEDCKQLVKNALADPALSDLNLTGANSINIARLLPQITFTMHAYARLVEMGVENADRAVYSMPCGNLSNLVAAVMAGRMGVPSGQLVAATNANNQLAPLMDGAKEPESGRRPIRTLAPSADMVYPSGWPRLLHLYNGDLAAMKRDIKAVSVDDFSISETINRLRDEHGYTIDPHGAMAYAAAADVPSDVPKVILATGHPAKQLDIMTRVTSAAIEMPVQLTQFMSVRRHATIIPPTLPALRKHLLNL